MRRALFCAALLWLAGALVLAGELPDHPLSLREVLEVLRARSPMLAAARKPTDATAAKEITAGLRPNSVFTSANEDFNVFNFQRAGFPYDRVQWFPGHCRRIPAFGGCQTRWSARAGTRVAEDTYRDTERQLELAVKIGFVNLLLAKSNLQLVKDNLRDCQETVRLNEIRLKVGEISPTEFGRIRLEQARFEIDVLSAQLAADQARVQLEGLLGLEDLPPSFDIEGELVAPELTLTTQELAQKALAARPDYLRRTF